MLYSTKSNCKRSLGIIEKVFKIDFDPGWKKKEKNFKGFTVFYNFNNKKMIRNISEWLEFFCIK